jgi:hypothetical protein
MALAGAGAALAANAVSASPWQDPFSTSVVLAPRFATAEEPAGHETASRLAVAPVAPVGDDFFAWLGRGAAGRGTGDTAASDAGRVAQAPPWAGGLDPDFASRLMDFWDAPASRAHAAGGRSAGARHHHAEEAGERGLASFPSRVGGSGEVNRAEHHERADHPAPAGQGHAQRPAPRSALPTPRPASRITPLKPDHEHGHEGHHHHGALSTNDPPLSMTEGTTSPQTTLTTFTDSDGNTNPHLYTATVNWGDGTTSAGTVQGSGGSGGFSVLGSHDYTEEGTYNVLISIHDQDGSNVTSTDTATVSDAALSWASGGAVFTLTPATAQPPTLTNPGNQTNAEGAAVSLQLQATSPNGYTLTYDAVELPVGLSLNTSTGLISGTVDYAAAEDFNGSYSAVVSVTDGHGGSASQAFTWTVTNTDRAPVVTNPGNQSNAQGDVVSLQLSASDPDNDQLTYDATGLPSGLSIDSGTGLISGTVDGTAAAASPYTVTVTASDGPLTASQTFTWTVTNANQAPVLTNPGNQTNAAGDTVSLPLSASDTDGDTVTYTATGLPAGLGIDPGSGLISGTIANSAAGATSTVTVTASDNALNSSQTFTWTVGYISMGNPGNQSNNTGDGVSLQITATDAAHLTLSYSATGLPTGLGINSSSGLISGTVGTSADSGSPYSVTVTASDGSHNASQSFTWTIAHLTLTNPGNQTTRAGAAASLQISGHDADGDTLT